MSTRTGFPRMDWDTGFLADPKFQHLRDLLPDPLQFGYAGFSFLRLTADAWRTCGRRPIGDVVRGIEVWAADALRDAGLLDADFRLSEESFDKWVGAALEAREVWKENKRKHRGSTSVPEAPKDSSDVQRGLRGGRNGRESTVEPVEQVGTDEGVQGEAAVFAFLAQHGAAIREDAPLGRRLHALMDRRTPETVLKEAQDMAEVEAIMSDRQWVLGLENGLEAIPSGRKSIDEAVAEEQKLRNDARAQRIQEQAQARRLEAFRWTGKWDTEFGPEPEWNPAWGERPSKPKVAA